MQSSSNQLGESHSIHTIVCPCCKSDDSSLFIGGRFLETFRFYEHLEGFEQLNYVQCRNCSLIYANPRLVYQDDTLNELFPDHVVRRSATISHNKNFLKAKKAAKVHKILQLSGNKTGRFLDVGCGFGFGLEAARDSGFEVVGTELFEGFIQHCRGEGFEVIQGSINQLPFDPQSFEVVFMEDVLEHLDNPFQFLDEASRVLAPGGILFVHTWMVDEPTTVEDMFGSEWRSDMNLDLTAHTAIFPSALLMEQLERRGFSCLHKEGRGLKGQNVTARGAQFTDLYLIRH